MTSHNTKVAEEPPLTVAVMGASGKMGAEVISILQQDPTTTLGAAIEREGHPLLKQKVAGSEIAYATAATAELDACSAIIAFTTPDGIATTVEAAKDNGLALVLGTTGITESDGQALAELAKGVPVLAAPNMSLGISVLCHLVAAAAKQLRHWDAEVFEIHHRAKVDAPSGTAARLGDVLRGARDMQDNFCMDRSGRRKARPDNEIGMSALRAGDVVGEHTVLLAGTGERLELTHRSMARSNFATGAVHAAKFLRGKAPRQYSMDDVLGLG